MDVNKAVLDEIKLPAPGLIKPIVEELTVEAPPTRISVKNNTIFFLFKLLYHVFPFDILSFLVHRLLFLFLTIQHLHLYLDRSFISQKSMYFYKYRYNHSCYSCMDICCYTISIIGIWTEK